MRRPFIFFSNTFNSVTRTSYTRMLKLSTYTYNALKGPDGIPALFTEYKGVHEAYVLCYNEWKAQRGMQKGKTASLADLFKGLGPTVAQWDLDIQRVYAKGTPEYIALLPFGRKPFTTGAQDERINAIAQLSIAIGTDAQLAAVKTSVDGYYTAILALNSAQKTDKVLTDTKSEIVEAARIAACEGLYSVLGSLMKLFKKDPLDIEKYFKMDLLRRIPQTEFTGKVPPMTTKEIMKRTMKPTTNMSMDNSGLVGLEWYVSATPGGPVPPGTTPILVPAGTTKHIVASELGDLTNKYLNVRNTSDIIEGEWEVAIYP